MIWSYVYTKPVKQSVLNSFWLLMCFLLFGFHANAQQNFPLDRDAQLPFEKLLNAKNCDFHTAVRPYLTNDLALVNDSALHFSHFKPIPQTDSTSRSTKFRFTATSDVLGLSGGYDFKNRSKIMDAYGSLGIGAYYNEKFALVVNYLGGNSMFPAYVDSAIRYRRVVPGVGSAYASGKGYSYQDLFGYLSYSPNRVFNFQMGKDKHFFGDGYRSMFLSDISPTYPFFKIQAHVWKIKWVNLFSVMTDATAPSGLQKDFKKKYSSMQYLSWNATKRINLSVFETIVWQGSDTNRVRGFDINYLNPVVFLRPTEYSLGSPDNALVGGSLKIKLPLQLQFYGQFLFDEFLYKELVAHKGWWGNKFCIQAGLKAFDFLGLENLTMLAEFNYVRPYTYTHGSVQQNYGHYNQPLANPFGANFQELVGILNYRTGHFIIDLKGVAAFTGLDSAGRNLGQNIFLPYTTRYAEYGNYVGQGRKTVIATGEFRVSYLLIPQMNLKIDLGLTYHTQRSAGLAPWESALITFGIRSSIYNTYRDY